MSAIAALARLFGAPPEPRGILCEESVRRGRFRHLERCGRPATKFVGYVIESTGQDIEYAYCNLHATVFLRAQGNAIRGPVTPDDHAAEDDRRLGDWTERGARALATLLNDPDLPALIDALSAPAHRRLLDHGGVG